MCSPHGTVGVRSKHQDVLVNHWYSGVRYPQLDLTLVPERGVAFARLGVQRNNLPQTREEDAGLGRLASRPVRNTSKRRQPLCHLMPPDFLAGLGPQGHDPIPCRQVHHTVNYDGRDLLEEFRRIRTLDEPILGMELVRPDLSQRADGAGVDLGKGRIARAGQVTVIRRPVGGGMALGRLGHGHQDRS